MLRYELLDTYPLSGAHTNFSDALSSLTAQLLKEKNAPKDNESEEGHRLQLHKSM